MRMTLAHGAAALVLLALAAPAVAAPTRTIDDLKTAFRGETTAAAKYQAYASEADREQHPAVASLFRAASAAERIHARNHKEALAKLGVPHPAAGFYHAGKTTTEENLRDAVSGESYERDTMYPQMIANARQENQKEAERSETYALKAETQHAALYTRSLEALGQHRAAASYAVCRRCGATWEGSGPKSCPACGQPRESFRHVR